MLLPYFCLSQSPQTIGNVVTVSFINNGSHTKFTLTSSLGGTTSNSLNNMWLSVGLNNRPIMVNIFVAS